MKDIITFINEYIIENKDFQQSFNESKTPKREFFEYVDVWIDEMYQEGLVNYDDDHIKEYAKGKSEPNYDEIVKGVMEEFKSEMSSQLKSMLEKFLKEEKHQERNKSEIIDTILTAIEQFASSI